MTGFEGNNKYKIKNSLGQNIFIALEGLSYLISSFFKNIATVLKPRFN